jgi:hypothetical protein
LIFEAKQFTLFLIYKINNMKNKPLGLWRRFLFVFTPTFLSRLNQENSSGKSWGFFFLSTFLTLMITAITISIFATIMLSDFPHNLIEKIPTETAFELPNGEQYSLKTLIQDFELTIDEKFKLQTKNIPDPLILAIDKKNKEPVFINAISEIDETTTAAVIVIDTKEQTITPEDAENFENAFFLLQDRVLIKEQKKKRTEILTFENIFSKEKNSHLPLTINLEVLSNARGIISKIFFTTLSITFGITCIFFMGFNLIMALFYALIFWGIGALAKIKNWNFEKSFIAMLHFSFIALLLSPIGIFIGIPFFSLIILTLFFGMNFYEMKKSA